MCTVGQEIVESQVVDLPLVWTNLVQYLIYLPYFIKAHTQGTTFRWALSSERSINPVESKSKLLADKVLCSSALPMSLFYVKKY